MAGLTLALADAVLKEDYKAPLREQLNNMNMLSARVAKNTEDLVGRRAVIPLHMGRNTGVGARLEGEAMPPAGSQGYFDQLVSLRSNYGRVRFTKQVITRMEKDRGAFFRAVASEMDGIRSDLGRDYNRQLWGTSDGVIAQCGASGPATLVQLATTTAEQIMVGFAENMVVDIGTVANPQLVASARTITAVDITNRTITISGANVTVTNVDFIFRAGSGGSGANQRELTGVQTMVNDSGALFGVDPATYFAWASIVEANGGVARAVSENVVAKAMMRSRNRSGQSEWGLYLEDQAFRAAQNNLAAKHRIVNSLVLAGGQKAIEYSLGGSTYPLIAERDCPVGKLYGLCEAKLTEFIDENWTWEDADGSVLHMSMDGTHTFEAYFYKFSEFATTQRNCHFRIDDLELA